MVGKSCVGLSFYVFFFCAIAASADPQPAGEFRFPNGSKVAFQRDGDEWTATYVNGTEQRLVTNERVIAPTQELLEAAPADSHLEAFVTYGNLWIVTQTGNAFALPLAHPQALTMAPVSRFSWNRIRDGETQYLLVSVVHPSVSAGETFVVREDGRWARIDAMPREVSGTRAAIIDGAIAVAGTANRVRLSDMTIVNPTASRENRNVYAFANGTRLVVRGGAQPLVYLLAADGTRRIVARNALLYTADDPGEMPDDFKAVPFRHLPPIALLETEAGVHLVTHSGHAIHLPADYASVANDAGRGWMFRRLDFVHGGKRHLVLNLRYRDGNARNNGETFVVREDGLTFRADYEAHDFPSTLTIRDGILDLGGGSRRYLDLDRLEGEARFPGRLKQQVLDGKGNGEIDPIKESDAHFGNLIAEVRQAPESALPPLEENTIEDILIGLGKREAGSVVVVGEAGTGKTQTIRALALRIAQGRVRNLPRTLRIYNVDAMGMSQGGRYVGTIEARLRALSEACRRTPALIFMDEIHSLVGSGVYEGNPSNIFQNLKTGLSEGSIRILGTSTEEEFYNAFAGDEAFMRRFTVVTKYPPADEAAVSRAMRQWSTRHSLPIPTPAVLAYAIRLSNTYNALGAQPAKATALLDFAVSLREMNGRLGAIDEADLRAAAMRLYNVNEAFFDPASRERLLANLPQALAMSVVGQHELRDALVELTRQFYAGVHDATKPAVRLLVSGPPGTGKTETARAYAEYMGLPFKRIEMTRYAYGDPTEFLAEVAAALRKNAFTVLAFDEMEKASLQVQQALLGLLDSGVFTVSERINHSGNARRASRVSALNATVIVTTNAGADFVLDGGVRSFGFAASQTGGDEAQRARRALDYRLGLTAAIVADGIPKVVVDRHQVVVQAKPPTRSEFAEVIQLHLRRAVASLSERQRLRISIANEEAFLQAMVDFYYYPGMSNRIALDLVQDYFRAAVGRALAAGQTNAGALTLTFDRNVPGFVTSCATAVAQGQ